MKNCTLSLLEHGQGEEYEEKLCVLKRPGSYIHTLFKEKNMNSLIRSFSSEDAMRKNRMYKIAGAAAIGLLSGLFIGKMAYADEGISHSDKSFLTSAIESDNAEIKASEMAIQKSTSPDVKSFAQKMIDEHQKTSDELKKIAAQKNVEAPVEPSLIQRTKIDALSKFSGASFDKHYASMIGVSAHQDAIKLFQKASTKSKDADIKQFATDTLPTLQTHLSMANDLKGKVENEK